MIHSTHIISGRRRPALFWALLALLWGAGGELHALPRFSLLTGTHCSACHFNPQGSGIRTDLGWSTVNRMGLINPDSVGLGSMFGTETNTFFDGLLTFGLDARLQYAQLGPSPAPHEFIFMQVAPAVAFTPIDELAIYGSYNFAEAAYPGQETFDVAVQYQPSPTLPSIRAGYIQPSIGLRHDDHTMFIRKDAAGFGTPIIPPNYNEWGAELTYEGSHLVTANLGVFASHNIAQKTELGMDSIKPTFLARLVLWPQILDAGLNGMVGASAFGNSDLRMVNAFIGIGMADKATIYGEGSYMHNSTDKTVRNLMLQGTYQLASWMNLEWRYEWGLSEQPSTGPFYAHSFVVGSQFFPLPYLELRPEYRWFRNDQYEMGQYTVQLHAFY